MCLVLDVLVIINKQKLLLRGKKMDKYVEICGTPIEIKSIKDYRIVKKEYIFRPVFREIPPKNFLFSTKYLFEAMEPYAAILDEKMTGFMKAKVKKYECENAAGRRMWLAIDEVPVLVYHADGHAAEVFKDNPNYALMGKDKSASIEMIEALIIQAKEKYVFYGRNIHLYSVLDGYNRIKEAIASLDKKKEKKDKTENVNAYETEEVKKDPAIDVGAYAKNIFGKVKNTVGTVKDTIGDRVEAIMDKDDNNISTGEMQANNTTTIANDKTGEKLKLLKSRYENGEITVEEFNLAVNKLLDNL